MTLLTVHVLEPGIMQMLFSSSAVTFLNMYTENKSADVLKQPFAKLHFITMPTTLLKEKMTDWSEIYVQNIRPSKTIVSPTFYISLSKASCLLFLNLKCKLLWYISHPREWGCLHSHDPTRVIGFAINIFKIASYITFVITRCVKYCTAFQSVNLSKTDQLISEKMD